METTKLNTEQLSELLQTRKRNTWASFYADLESSEAGVFTKLLPYSLRASLKQKYARTHNVHWAKVDGGYAVWLEPIAK